MNDKALGVNLNLNNSRREPLRFTHPDAIIQADTFLVEDRFEIWWILLFTHVNQRGRVQLYYDSEMAIKTRDGEIG